MTSYDQNWFYYNGNSGHVSRYYSLQSLFAVVVEYNVKTKKTVYAIHITKRNSN